MDHLKLSGAEGQSDGMMDDDGDEAAPAPAYCLTVGTVRKHLRLDSAAAAAVTLLPDPTLPHQYGSLFSVLNRWVALPRSPRRSAHSPNPVYRSRRSSGRARGLRGKQGRRRGTVG